uniref:Uncharacterized protein n=1 Tax=Romanomermis culicivorax TaxID=13658 RepID=A0A915I590_ROMCU
MTFVGSLAAGAAQGTASWKLLNELAFSQITFRRACQHANPAYFYSIYSFQISWCKVFKYRLCDSFHMATCMFHNFEDFQIFGKMAFSIMDLSTTFTTKSDIEKKRGKNHKLKKTAYYYELHQQSAEEDQLTS